MNILCSYTQWTCFRWRPRCVQGLIPASQEEYLTKVRVDLSGLWCPTEARTFTVFESLAGCYNPPSILPSACIVVVTACWWSCVQSSRGVFSILSLTPLVLTSSTWRWAWQWHCHLCQIFEEFVDKCQWEVEFKTSEPISDISRGCNDSTQSLNLYSHHVHPPAPEGSCHSFAEMFAFMEWLQGIFILYVWHNWSVHITWYWKW